jgi:predicted nucleotidyltransferase
VGDPREGINPAGIIVTGAARVRIQPDFEPVLAAGSDLVSNLDASASLYVYGSVANGTAVVARSDVDLLSIGLDERLALDMARGLSDRFRSLGRAVEIAAGTDEDYFGDGDEAYGNRAFLRHYCVHLTGPSRHADLPDVTADERAARGFNGDIAQHLERWQRALEVGDDPVAIGRLAARKTLLALTGIVSVQDNLWTTDRSIAASRWTERNPGSSAEVTTLVDWADGTAMAMATTEQLSDVLEGIVGSIVDEFARTVGLWNDT